MEQLKKTMETLKKTMEKLKKTMEKLKRHEPPKKIQNCKKIPKTILHPYYIPIAYYCFLLFPLDPLGKLRILKDAILIQTKFKEPEPQRKNLCTIANPQNIFVIENQWPMWTGAFGKC